MTLCRLKRLAPEVLVGRAATPHRIVVRAAKVRDPTKYMVYEGKGKLKMKGSERERKKNDCYRQESASAVNECNFYT